ncbi:hypothetical protein SADO_14969 [Salinisphaera dokdonensis CL-ES53]|uniref:Uncharacterized protein n=1 Tax=Salinisphaera dokdonensis CL-ES53 TaxID=1304272 RepID=A0ABV2B3U3_9GAMM
MQNRTVTRIASVAVLASLLGFSTLGFAQSEAVEAMNARADQATTATTSPQAHPMADALAADLDAHNKQDTEGRLPETHVPADEAPQQVAQQTRQLSADLDAYNASATDGLVPSTHMPANADNHSADPQAQELAAELTRYNQSGGSLNSVRF